MARPVVVFACAHLCDERLYTQQVAALSEIADCRVFAFREYDALGKMATHLLLHTPERFALVGLSLGGYLAFEIVRRAHERLLGLALMDTRADADDAGCIEGRHKDIALVQTHGIDALAPQLPARWMHPEHAQDPALSALVVSMARSIGAQGQFNQQQAMLKRPESFTDLARVTVPTLLVCGREDKVTPLAQHEKMRDALTGTQARLEIVERCGHLATIEQPQATSALLRDWIASLATH